MRTAVLPETAQPTDGEGVVVLTALHPSVGPVYLRDKPAISPVRLTLRSAWQSEINTMRRCIKAAVGFGIAALITAASPGNGIEAALFFILPIASGFALAAVHSRRRADSIFARELAARLAEGAGDPTEYAEAA